MSDGGILILFLVVLFFLWLLAGGPSHPNVDKPFEKVNTEQQATSPTSATSVQMNAQ